MKYLMVLLRDQPSKKATNKNIFCSCDSKFLCPRHLKNGGGALSVTPVCPSVIKIWCPLNNFWKTAWIQFKFSMLIYNIKRQVEFDLGYNPLIFDRVMGLLLKHSTAEPRWFEVIGTASNTSKYWGFELTNYEHPYLPTEKYVEL